MEDSLNQIFKKYVAIFINEYRDFLSIEQLEALKSVDYNNAIVLDNVSKPFGVISLGKVHLANTVEKLIKNFHNMPNYNKERRELDNKNMASYLKYMCDNGYDVKDYYSDILMYFVFKLVIKESSGLINGLINQEIRYLSIKYSIRLANLYAREEAIVDRITPIIGLHDARKIMFMDSASAFKYLNEKHGFRIAKLVLDIDDLIDNEYHDLEEKNYSGYNGFLDYTSDYDHILYGDVYNHILDFEVENMMTN